MLEQHVNSAADVTVGCIEVPRTEASAFGVMHVEHARSHRVLSRKARRSASHAGPARRRCHMGSMCSSASSCSSSCAAMPTTRIQGTIRRRHHSPSGQARQSRRPSLYQLVVRGDNERRRTGATSALLMLIGKRTSISPTSCRRSICTTKTGRSGPTPRSAAGQVRARRGGPPRHGHQLAGLWRLHHLGQPDRQVAPVHRRARDSYSVPEHVVALPMCRSTARRLEKVVIDRGVKIPAGSGGRRGSRARRQRFRRTDKRRLPDHPADDRPAAGLSHLA